MSAPGKAVPLPDDVRPRAWVADIMGLPVSVHVRVSTNDVPTVAEEVERFFDHLRHFDRIFSLWKEGSDLSRMRRGEISLAACAPEIRQVMELCDEAEDLTQGWFTAWTLGPAVLAGFDPTGIVKGFAVERAASRLREQIVHDVAVNAGGDIDAWTQQGSAPWRFGIEDPNDRERLVAIVELNDGGLATSGNAARGPHIRDPRTGRTVDALGSVSIWGDSLTWADAVATAAFASAKQWRWVESLVGIGYLVVAGDGSVVTGAGRRDAPQPLSDYPPPSDVPASLPDDGPGSFDRSSYDRYAPDDPARPA